MLEGPDGQSCGLGRLTFGEYSEIQGHKSPVILKFLQERLEEEGLLKKREFEEAETARVPAWRPLRFDSAESALDEGFLPGLFPSSHVGRVRRSLLAPSLRVRRSPSTPEMPSRKFQEYQCSDGSTSAEDLLLAYSQIANPVSSLVSTWYFLVSPCLTCPEYLMSDNRTFSGRLPRRVPKTQPGDVLRVQDMNRSCYSPLPECTISGETTFGEQPPPTPRPKPPGTRCPQSGFLPRPTPAEFHRHPREAFLEYQLSDGSTFSGRLPPGSFPNLQAGEVVDIQDNLRRGSSSLPSREVPEHDLSDGRVFGGHPSTPSSSQAINQRGPEDQESTWRRRIDKLRGASLYARVDFLCLESPLVSMSGFAGFLILSSFFSYFLPFPLSFIMWAK